MIGVITAMGNDELGLIDPTLATMIPERGDRIPYEEIYLAGELSEEGVEPALAANGEEALIDSIELMGVDVSAASGDMWAA